MAFDLVEGTVHHHGQYARLRLPQPLLDRMEVMRLAGYSEEEKVVIANRYLIPRQLKETGLIARPVGFPDDGC